jgi:hypothetical protein
VGAFAATWHQYIYGLIKTLVGAKHYSIFKTHFFKNTQNQELKGFDLGSPTRKPCALTTWARAASYISSDTFILKGEHVFGAC